MASESGIERRATWWNGSVARYGEVAGEARMPFFLSDPSAVCMFGWVGHRNGDRDCEPAQLTEHQATARARDGGKLGRVSPEYRAAQNPATVARLRGFATPKGGNDAC